ncbi:hypothetical protein OIU34_22295 [Pararhizobium sp. BT-229]|uniref:hypothetical protein n=1 Tax=Pararhizobium sp. BT-229 TaxID=2986923 RepID=UPI0021F749B5|nr:hypothetical protein [Pararhizobium sp. BT-229]MCV9964625.1 hypothetical protein [Pararhizobium sp. BT-229]
MTFEEAQRITAQALAIMGMELYDPRPYLAPEVFGEFMSHALRIANPELAVEFIPPVTVTIERREQGGAKQTLNCTRPFKAFGLDMENNANLLVKTVTTFQDSVASNATKEKDEPDFSRVVPLLKSAPMHARSLARNEAFAVKHGKDPVGSHFLSWKVSEEVVAVLAINEPNRFLFLTEEMRAERDISFEELKATALANLATHHREARIDTDYDGGMAEISGTGCAASSYILLEDFLKGEAEKAGDDVLHIFSSETDHLVIMPAANAHGVASALAGIKIGALPTGDIPPMVCENGSLRELSREDIERLITSLGDGPQPPRRRM